MPLSDDQSKTVMAIVVKLAQLGHEVSFTEPITEGPLITTFRFLPKAAAKVAQIVGCADDLALALHVDDVLVRRLPGEGSIGVSVPNTTRTLVNWRDTLRVDELTRSMNIPLNFGVDSQGRQFREDLTALPHLLVAGSTNSGKSTCITSMIASLMFWRTPDEVQFVLSDTKNVEFGHFVGSPHLLFDPATTMYQTWERMDWLIEEIDRRLKTIGRAGLRNIGEYNERDIRSFTRTGYPNNSLKDIRGASLAYIVLVIDELADVLSGEKRGEAKIAAAKLGRIVQKSRAAGVHVLATTQRPSVNVVSGSIKANFPSRLTFRLPSEADSRTVIGVSGAEHLIAQGDMLYSSANYPALKRLHSAYASIDDVRQAVDYAKMKEMVKRG